MNYTKIPIAMTSNITPSPFEAMAGTQYSSTYGAHNVFTGDTTQYNRWMAATGVASDWVGIKLDKTYRVCKIRIYTSYRRSYNSLYIYGSNDNSNYTLLASYPSETITHSTWVEYIFDNNNKYLYYKFSFTAGEYSSFEINEIELYEISIITKFLVQDGTLLKTISGGNLITVCNTTDSVSTIETAFTTSGLDDLSTWSNSLMSQVITQPPKIALYRIV